MGGRDVERGYSTVRLKTFAGGLGSLEGVAMLVGRRFTMGELMLVGGRLTMGELMLEGMLDEDRSSP